MNKEIKLPRNELTHLNTIWKEREKCLNVTSETILSTLKSISINDDVQSPVLKMVNASQRNEKLYLLLDQIELLKKNYPIINLFVLKEQQDFIEDIINWRRKKLNTKMMEIFSQSLYDENIKDLRRSWYSDLIKEKPEVLSMSILDQITLLFKETDKLTDFTDKKKIYWKTLFRNLGLSPFILANTKRVDEYLGYKNITVWNQYFLSWLHNDKKTFWKLEMSQPYFIPYKEWENISEIKMVNTSSWEYGSYKSDITFASEISSKTTQNKENLERQQSIDIDLAKEFISLYLSEAKKFSDAWYESRRQNQDNNNEIPERLSSLIRPIIKEKEWTTLIHSSRYYQAIRDWNDKEQKEIEFATLNKLEREKNDYSNITGIIIYKKIIDDNLLTTQSIWKILESKKYIKLSSMVYNAIQTAHKYYVWSLEEISLSTFIDALNKRYDEIKDTEIFVKALEDVEKMLW